MGGFFGLLVYITRKMGIVAPQWMASGGGGYEIGLIGATAFSGPTVRKGFQRLARSMPIHCTHEMCNFQSNTGPQERSNYLIVAG